ncbi:signal peptide peptidase-domain-containing protein [Mycotypha africana]|uniref:signal peptide peptidase-domain-containing protein n=1 Tax=Mycotypha africana TaxID=64632 RepID=UPI0023015FFB|nr:signal peptide peptidase-domain-containing protein [Mycotypha africana]KAI8977379.1 signal peptide peptidase-domain-containing protein [Mycotypha africana]
METDTNELGLYMAYGAVLTMAVIPIYAGSLASVKGMKRPTNAPKQPASDNPLDDSDDEDDTVLESLSSGDAYLFPVIGSAVLFSMYLAFRYLDKEYINYILTIYFSVMGCAAVTKAFLMVARKTLPMCLLKHVAKYKVTLSKKSKNISHISFTVIHGVLLLASIGLTAYYSYTKNWIASNIFGLSFSINAIQLLSLDSFKTGIILLSGLFVYDIFWVFYTPVMVSVATNFDAPIKLLWPRNIIEYVTYFIQNHSLLAESKFTMLGLGDIVIPGIFVALCLRFDRHMSWKRNPVGPFRTTNFPKPYFIANLTAYIFGLALTMFVMHVYKAAQPALLYLSPACILSSLITAAVRGELKEYFAFTTEDEKEKDKKKNKEEIDDKVKEVELFEQEQQKDSMKENNDTESVEVEEEDDNVAESTGSENTRTTANSRRRK